MMKTLNLLLALLLGFNAFGQVLSDLIPSTLNSASHVEEIATPSDFRSSNAYSKWGANYYDGDQLIMKVKAGLYTNSTLDFDEKEHKFGLGYELVDIDIFKLKGITFPVMEFDTDGHDRYMTQFSIFMRSDNSFEIQNFFDLEKYSNDTRQLRYVVSAKTWEPILELLSYLFHQTSKSRISIYPSEQPLERLYVDDYDFSSYPGFVNVFAVGHYNEIMIFESKIANDQSPVISRRYLVNGTGLHSLKINDIPQTTALQKITISDINHTVLVESQMGKEIPVILTDPADTPETPDDPADTNEEDTGVDTGVDTEEISVFPNVVVDELTVRKTRNPLQANNTEDILLLDQSGNLIKKMSSQYQETRFDMSDVRTGLYYLVYNDGRKVTTTIVTKI